MSIEPKPYSKYKTSNPPYLKPKPDISKTIGTKPKPYFKYKTSSQPCRKPIIQHDTSDMMHIFKPIAKFKPTSCFT